MKRVYNMYYILVCTVIVQISISTIATVFIYLLYVYVQYQYEYMNPIRLCTTVVCMHVCMCIQ